MKRHYYARHNAYGVWMGGIAIEGDSFLAFGTKKERNEFVNAEFWDGSNCIWAEATYKEVRSKYPYGWDIDADGWCEGV